MAGAVHVGRGGPEQSRVTFPADKLLHGQGMTEKGQARSFAREGLR